MTTRPDFVHCIAHTHEDKKGFSWCGRRITMEWHFVSIDHATLNGEQDGYPQACDACSKLVIAALTKGTWAP